MLSDKKLSNDDLENLSTINKARTYLFLTVISVLISLKILDIDRKNILYPIFCPEKTSFIPDKFPLNLTVNLIDISTTLYFFILSKKLFQDNTDKKNCSPKFNLTASSLVLIAGVIRLYNIFYQKSNDDTSLSDDILDTEIL